MQDLERKREGFYGLKFSLIRDADNGNIHCTKDNVSSFEINVERLARDLARHLMPKIHLVKPDEQQFKYLLCGLRLLHALCDIASHHILEQVLFVDVKVTEQMLDLIFFMIIVLARYKKKVHASSHPILLHSALLACSFYFLKTRLSSEWLELSDALLDHPKVLKVLKIMFCGDGNGVSVYHPRGVLQLNAMRLTEILSADSDFWSYITLNFTEVLTKVFLVPQGKFMSSWCSTDHEPVEDVTLYYDSFLEAGHVLGVESTSQILQWVQRLLRLNRFLAEREFCGIQISFF